MRTPEACSVSHSAIHVSQLARAVWHFTNSSVEELAMRARFPASAKTLWRLIQGQEPWGAKYAESMIGCAAECLRLPPERLWRYLHSAEARLDPAIQQFVLSRFWHLNPRSRERLDKCMQRHESAARRSLYSGVVPPLCFFPERTLRRFVRYRCLAEKNASRHVIADWTAFGLNWREHIFNTSSRPPRILVALRSTFHAIRDRVPPFDCLDLEDAREMLSSLAYDMVRERGLRIGLLDRIAGIPETHSPCLFADGSFSAMTDDFLLKREGVEPLLRTIERDRGAEQGIALDQELVRVQGMLDAIGGPMSEEESFEFLLSFLE